MSMDRSPGPDIDIDTDVDADMCGNMDSGSGCSGCFPISALIHIPNGHLKRIDALAKGDRVLCSPAGEVGVVQCLLVVKVPSPADGGSLTMVRVPLRMRMGLGLGMEVGMEVELKGG